MAKLHNGGSLFTYKSDRSFNKTVRPSRRDNTESLRNHIKEIMPIRLRLFTADGMQCGILSVDKLNDTSIEDALTSYAATTGSIAPGYYTTDMSLALAQFSQEAHSIVTQINPVRIRRCMEIKPREGRRAASFALSLILALFAPIAAFGLLYEKQHPGRRPPDRQVVVYNRYTGVEIGRGFQRGRLPAPAIYDAGLLLLAIGLVWSCRWGPRWTWVTVVIGGALASSSMWIIKAAVHEYDLSQPGAAFTLLTAAGVVIYVISLKQGLHIAPSLRSVRVRKAESN